MIDASGGPSLADTLPDAVAKPETPPDTAATPPAPAETPEWIKDLPDDLKSSKSLAKFKDDGWKSNLAKSYVEAEKMIGSSVRVPKADAPQEEWDKFYAKLRPEGPDKYEIGKVEGFEDPAFEKAFKEKAHANGLTGRQAAEMYKHFASLEVDAAKQMAAKRSTFFAEQKATLEKAFGDRYAAEMQSAAKALKAYGGDLDMLSELKVFGADNSAKLWQFLARIGSEIKEDTTPGGGAPPANGPSVLEQMYPSMARKE